MQVGDKQLSKLKQALFSEYDGFADNRITDFDKGHIFIVDDRGPGDVGAEKNLLLPHFCLIFADLTADGSVKVSLHRNVPLGKAVIEWIARHNAWYDKAYPYTTLEFTISNNGQLALNELADAFRAIVAPNASPYSVPNYRYMCPRTATSLERLKGVLDEAWKP
ncbi:MAG: hypothetical protein JWO91_621 [Acidobacteriaceae bacterium]|nr:hypothetical protein [Acidobacteriaceae bacterium]